MIGGVRRENPCYTARLSELIVEGGPVAKTVAICSVLDVGRHLQAGCVPAEVASHCSCCGAQ
jgi:hypothetical protein